MHLKIIKKSKRFTKKKFLLFSAITIVILCSSNGISQPLTNSLFNEVNKFSKKSFITIAVEKTGSSVVTIETQKFIKRKKNPRISELFLDPYFERFFGLDLPYENQPKIEQSQGSGFIFENGLIMTNAHVVNGSDKVIVGLTNGKKISSKTNRSRPFYGFSYS